VSGNQQSGPSAETFVKKHYRHTAHFLGLRIAELRVHFYFAGNVLSSFGGRTHGRSISSSRHILCVRLLRRTARKDCESRYGLAPRKSVFLQRILRRRIRAAS
jgi:hypothetical protein